MNKQPILIVDDNPTNLELLSETLINEGYQISVATDGRCALEQLEYYQPSLILLDVMMPELDGFETCRYIKANELTRDIPVIFMTALNESADKVKGLSLGAVDYITKPFQTEEVLARIRIHQKLHNLTVTLEEQNRILRNEINQRRQTELAMAKLNEELERRVEERTIELSQALEDLKQAQVHLVQSEKMSSLGQLVGGIAHEINNPVNFIYGNIPIAANYSHNLLNLVKLYQKHFVGNPKEIDSYLREIDFDFLEKDLPKTLTSMQMGVDRIRQIVLSLRNFSRLDESAIKTANLHEGIESTLLILQSRLKGKTDKGEIQIIRNYGKLPEIICYPSQLNQVFMNLLSNAIDALETKAENLFPQAFKGEIEISTKAVDEHYVEIQISDNASGIPQDVISKIFNPFFTTKPPGKGTGLGLPISYSIIKEKHRGELVCQSSTEGSKFIIRIPILQKLEIPTSPRSYEFAQTDLNYR